MTHDASSKGEAGKANSKRRRKTRRARRKKKRQPSGSENSSPQSDDRQTENSSPQNEQPPQPPQPTKYKQLTAKRTGQSDQRQAEGVDSPTTTDGSYWDEQRELDRVEQAKQRTLKLLGSPDDSGPGQSEPAAAEGAQAEPQTAASDVTDIIVELQIMAETPTMASPEASQPQLMDSILTRDLRLAEWRPLDSVPHWAREAMARQVYAAAMGVKWVQERTADGRTVQKMVQLSNPDLQHMRAAWNTVMRMDSNSLRALIAQTPDGPILPRDDVDDHGRPLPEAQRAEAADRRRRQLELLRQQSRNDDVQRDDFELSDEKSAALLLNQALRELQRRQRDNEADQQQQQQPSESENGNESGIQD